MDIQIERKIQVNKWIIKARWFYVAGILAIGFLTKLISHSNVYFSYTRMIFFVLIVFIANLFFYLYLKKIERDSLQENVDVGNLDFLGSVQIGVELVVLAMIMNSAGGIESMSIVFFFLPVVSSSLLFSINGTMMVAVLSGVIVNFLVIAEYYGIVPHVYRYGINTFEFSNLSVAITKSLTTSFFYFIVAAFSGFGSKLLFERELMLKEKAEKLKQETEYRENEWKQLEKTSKLLVKRDSDLLSINKELDKKVKDLERSEKAMITAFSDLNEARQRTEKERNKTEAIISNFIDPIIVIDKDNKISLLNPAAMEIFGFSGADLDKAVDTDNNFSMNNFKKILKQDFSVKSSEEIKSSDPNEEEVVINFSGHELTYKVITAQVIDRKKEVLGTMKIFYNLTREKMIDKLKSEFISIAAHQLRTPLSAIKWAIKMVLDGDTGPLNPDQEKMLFKGYQSNERIIILVNDMLNVSRIEEGRFGYNFALDNFEEVVQTEIDNLQGLIKRSSINLVLNKPEKLPLVYMDKQKMGLVIQNLLENAVKYTPEHGKIEVTIEASPIFLKVKVKDNGVGIPEKELPKLFSKFFRADNVIRMQTEGSGLGLFIVRNIIKKHGGEITVNSKEGKGTEFVFTIPISAQN